MTVSKSKSLNKKGEISSPSKSTRKRKTRRISPTATRKSSRIESKMENEAQTNQTHEKDDCHSEVLSEKDTPQDKIDQLKENLYEMHHLLQSVSEENFILTGMGGTWVDYSVDKWRRLISQFEISIKHWAHNYAHKSIGDLEYLSKEQKKQIISSLDGYCVQDDFDSLVSRFPHDMRDRIPQFFVQIFLIKDIFARFFENPFWYFSGNPESHDYDEESEQKNALFGRELGCLYNRFLDINPIYGRIWRQITVRLSNATTICNTKNPKFGKQIHCHRDALVRSIMSKLLSNKTFLCLLRATEDTEDKEEREESITVAYQHAANLSGYLLTNHESLEFQDPAGTVPYFHHQILSTVDVESLHFLEEGSTRLDGHPVLAVTRPAVFKRGSLAGPSDNDAVLISKPRVIVADTKGGVEARESEKEPKTEDH